jgi:O-antigen ligase
VLLPVQTRRLTGAAVVGAGAMAAVAAGLVAAHPSTVPLALAGALGLAFVVLAVRDFAAALAIFVVLTFVEQIPGAGSGVTPVKAAGAVLVLLWVLGLLQGRFSVRALLGGRIVFGVAVAALVLFAAASAAWATSPGTALSSAFRLAQGVLLAVVVATCVRERRALRLVLVAFVAGAAVSAVLGLAGLAGAADATSATDVRVGGGLGDPNYLAAVLVPGVFLAVGLWATVSSRRLRLSLLAVDVVLVVSLLRTESRGGLVAIAVCAVAALFVGGPMRRAMLGSVAGVALAVVVYFAVFASAGSMHRVLDLGTSGSASSGRTELWGVAMRAFEAHPLAGVGAGNFPVVEPTYAAATDANLTKSYLELDLGEVVHNTYLHVLAELGAIGLAFFATAVGSALWLGWLACRRCAARGDRLLEAQCRCLLIGSVGMLAAFAFLSAQYEKQLWLVLGLLLAVHALARADRPGD